MRIHTFFKNIQVTFVTDLETVQIRVNRKKTKGGEKKFKTVQETFKPSCIFQQVSLLSFLHHGILSESRTEENISF